MASAVVIGGYVNGLGVVRGLAAHGVRTAVVATRCFDVAQHSRYAAGSRYLPELHVRPDALLELLDRESTSWRGAALFPTNDHALQTISRHHEVLSRTYRLTTQPWDVLLRKDETHRLAERLGIPTARVHGPADSEIAASPVIRYPVVVKPVEGHVFAEAFGCKLFVAGDAAELAAQCAKVAAAGIEAQVLDFVPGHDDHVYAYFVYVGERGEPVAGVTIRKLRQSPPLVGVSRVAEIVDDRDDVRDAAVELLRSVGFRGMADVQFKLDPRDGTMRLTDVNARSVVYNSLASKAGLDLPYMAWSDAVRGERTAPRRNGWTGVWIHLHADLLYSALFRHIEGHAFADYLAPYRRPKALAIWSARDPKPFAVQWARTARDAARTLGARRVSEELRSRVGSLDPELARRLMMQDDRSR
jgi:D-aspartate ligase